MPLQFVRTDIVHMDVDAIVNAANSSLAPGGGVCGAIFAAAGYDKLDRACRRIGHCDVGEAVLTPGFALKAKWVIHAVGPIWRGGLSGERTLLRSAYWNALDLAADKGCRSVAFPLISSGIYGYPKEEALQVAVDAIRDFLLEHELQVYLILFGPDTVVLSPQRYADLQSYLARHWVEQPPGHREAEQPVFQRQLAEQAEAEQEENFFSALSQVFRRRKDEAAPEPTEPRAGQDTGALPRLEEAVYSTPAAPSPVQESEVQRRDLGRSGAASPAPPPPAASPRQRKRSLEDLLFHLEDSFSESLLRLIDEKGMTDVEVYKRANLDRKLFSKLRKASYQPGKRTVIALAVALRLNLDETTDLLRRAGYALSPSSRSDVIVRYFIEERIYDIFALNEALFSFGEKLLGA